MTLQATTYPVGPSVPNWQPHRDRGARQRAGQHQSGGAGDDSPQSQHPADLGRYAALHAQTYGEAVNAATLIPHILEAFMAGTGGFRKGTATRSAPSKPT